MIIRFATIASLSALVFATQLASPRVARACGGFFCNQPDSPFGPLPVAQTAENVLFAVDPAPSGKSRLEAHVQIFYTGPADRFSWVVPVDGEPELDVGSNQLFTTLDRITKPRFTLNWHDEGTCKEEGRVFPESAASADRAGADAGSDAGSRGGVEVAFRGDVGPYDASVLRSTDPKDPSALKQWLADNKYYMSDAGNRLIDDYVRQEKWFVAIRLQSGKDVKEIAPLVMKFEGPGPCVPLRLTAIAALKDLRINLWVLGKSRAVPQNYLELKVNPARINWFSGGDNYDELLKKAADEAGGNAFGVDFVGATSALQGVLYKPGQYNIGPLAAATTPPAALNALSRAGIPRDSALLALLRKHIPQPKVLVDMNIDERQFYNQLASYWQKYQADFTPFDGKALAADVDAKLVKPLEKAQALLDRYPKLTRLSTFISPEEMTSDPTFAFNPTLPDVAVERKADAFRVCGDKLFTYCAAPVRLELPGGQIQWFKPSSAGACDQDRRGVDDLPALERAWQRDTIGEGVIRHDKRQATTSALAARNRAVDDYIANADCGCAIGGRAGRTPAVYASAALALGLLVMRRRRRR